jgi:hypothetical protein
MTCFPAAQADLGLPLTIKLPILVEDAQGRLVARLL